MSTQPEALRLADKLLTEPNCECDAYSVAECSCDTEWPEQYMEAAAAELRRLFAENEALKITVLAEREACAKLCEEKETYGDPVQCWLDDCAASIRARGET